MDTVAQADVPCSIEGPAKVKQPSHVEEIDSIGPDSHQVSAKQDTEDDSSSVDDETEPGEFPIMFFEKPIPAGAMPSNMADLIMRNYTMFPNCRCYGTREFLPPESGKNVRGPYAWYNYKEASLMAAAFAWGLRDMGFKEGDKMLIMSPNRTEWQVADMSLGLLGMVAVPLYDSQSEEEIVHVALHSEAKGMFIAPDRLPKIAKIFGGLRSLKHIIIFDDRLDDRVWLLNSSEKLRFEVPGFTRIRMHPREELDAAEKEMGNGDPMIVYPGDPPVKHGEYPKELRDGFFDYIPPTEVIPPNLPAELASIPTESWTNVLNAGWDRAIQGGISFPDGAEDRSLEDLFILQYTSGTTGLPKGAMLTFRNVLTGALALYPHLPPELRDPKILLSVNMSYLPNAHIFQHVLCYMWWYVASGTAYFQGYIPALMDDVAQAQPHVFPSVPRVLQKLVDTIMHKLECLSPIKRLLFFSVYDSVRRNRFKGVPSSTIGKVLSKKIFADIRKSLGGRTHLIASGSAPLAPKTSEFLMVTFDTNLIEGYGLSETAAISCCQAWDDVSSGNVGHVMANTQVKLVSVPTLDYYVTDLPYPRGEIYVRGDSIFKGYYKDPEKTAEVFTPDGWYKTGDVGAVLADGKLQIIDRVRNIFKLSQGEYVSAAEVERAIEASPFVAQCVLHGSRYESFTLAIINIQQSAVKKVFPDSNQELEGLCRDPTVIARVHQDIIEKCRGARLNSYEIPKAIIIDPVVWSPENNFATPSMKLKTSLIRAAHADQLADIYARIKKSGLGSPTPEESAQITTAYFSEGPLSDVSVRSGSSMFSRSSIFGV